MPETATEKKTETSGNGETEAWRQVQDLPCELTLDLPLPGFKVRDLLRLDAGSVLDSGWKVGADLPLRVNGTLIAWSEFEVVAERLAARVTEVA
ncbi:MAG: FliM/FliN family flagellar motor switch protein [Acidobacteriia bacterium]|nr:FliM/FliN family flagellar motor switch protein [Terriglobia bacterium]